MKISWPDIQNNRLLTGRIEAQAHPYIEALGVDNAAQFLLHFGGSLLPLPTKRAHKGTELSKVLQGMYGDGWKDKALQLGRCVGHSCPSVPLTRTFLCRYLRSQGKSVNDIARILKTSGTTVYRHLKGDEARREKTLKHREQVIRQADSYRAHADA